MITYKKAGQHHGAALLALIFLKRVIVIVRIVKI